MSEYIGGWLIDEENFDELNKLPGEEAVLQLVGSYQEVSLDPREVIKVENQSNQGACQGHAISTCVEWCYCIETGKWDTQLSRAMGYYESQRIDNIRGDRGSTISAGCKLASETGICEESLWPYPSRYNSSRPRDFDAVLQNAENYQVGSLRRLTTYDGVRAFLGSGQGGINIGISWTNDMSKSVVNSFPGGGGGGHAIALLSLSERKDASGRPYVWMCNSWGSNWGNNGWSEWAPKAMNQMFSHRFTTAIGVSDMPNVKPREFTLDDWKAKLKA